MFRFTPLLIVAAVLILPALVSARWIDDVVRMETDATGVIEFSHFNHLEAVGKNCVLCHNKVFHIVRDKNPEFSMAEMEKGQSCGACHNGNKAFSVSDDCSSCHPTRDIVFQTEATGGTLFSHDIHTGMYSCSDCHSGIFTPDTSQHQPATMAQMNDGESCGACHDGDTAFSVQEDCSSCHPTKEITYKIEDGDAKFSHEVHTGMYGCSDCHSGIFVPDQSQNKEFTMEEMAEGESCGACHDGDTAFTVEDNCDSCHDM